VSTGTLLSSKNGALARSSAKSLGLAARVRGHLPLVLGLRGWHRQLLPQHLPQVHLLRIGHRREALALAAEQLPLEPLDLSLQPRDLFAPMFDRGGLRLQHRGHVMRIECGHFCGIRHSGGHRDRHDAMVRMQRCCVQSDPPHCVPGRSALGAA
jgi:hypothetical protein